MRLDPKFVDFAHQYSIVKDLKTRRGLQVQIGEGKRAVIDRAYRFATVGAVYNRTSQMEMIGFEPTASAVQVRRSPN